MRIKTTIKKTIINIRYVLCLAFTFFRKRLTQIRNKRFLILTSDSDWMPNEKCSFGDDIMFLTICHQLKLNHPTCEISFLHLNSKNEKIRKHDFFGFEVNEISEKKHLNHLNKVDYIRICQNRTDLIVMGADVLDGGYGIENSINRLKLANTASKLGLKTRILGFSYKELNNKLIHKQYQIISKKVKLYVRDKISFERLINVTKNKQRNLNLSADITFLLSPLDVSFSEKVNLFTNQLISEKTNSNFLVGINLINWHLKDKSDFLIFIADQIKQIILRNQKTKFVFIPHDLREEFGSDLKVLEELYDILSPQLSEKILFADFITHGIEAKLIAGLCDIVITSRMHLAIAAMSQNVPAISFVYQGKFEGLYKMYNLDNSFMFEVSERKSLVEKVFEILQNKEGYTEILQAGNLRIIELAKRNFEGI